MYKLLNKYLFIFFFILVYLKYSVRVGFFNVSQINVLLHY